MQAFERLKITAMPIMGIKKIMQKAIPSPILGMVLLKNISSIPIGEYLNEWFDYFSSNLSLDL